MISDLPRLEGLLRSLGNVQNPEECERANELLCQWRADFASLPLCLEVLNTSPADSLAFQCASTISWHLENSTDKFTETDIDTIFQTCLARLHSDRNVFDSASEKAVIQCMAFIAVRSVRHLQVFETLKLHEVLWFFDFVFGKLTDIAFEPSREVFETAESLIPVIVEVLKQAPVNDIWLSLHTKALVFTPQFPCFSPLLPILSNASKQLEFIPGLLAFYEAVLKFEPVNADFDQLQYIVHVISIMLPCALALMQNPDSNRVAAASFIWSTLFEYGVDFFCQKPVIQFAMTVFSKFLSVLPSFLIDLDEFYVLLDVACHLFGLCAYKDVVHFGRFATSLIDIICAVVDGADVDFSEPRMEDAVVSMTQWDNPFISRYICQSARTPRSGIYYVVAYSRKKLRQALAPLLISSLTAVSGPVILSFIDRCCRFVPEHVPGLLPLVYELTVDNPSQGVKTIQTLAKRFPFLFVQDLHSFFEPLVEIALSAPLDKAAYVLSAIFAILPHLSSEDSAPFLESIFRALMCSVEVLLGQGDMSSYLDFVTTVIDAPTSPPSQEFANKAALAIIEMTGRASADPLYVETMTELMVKMVECNWLADKQSAAEWALHAMTVQILSRQYDLLGLVADVIPPDVARNLKPESIAMYGKFVWFMQQYFRARPLDFCEAYKSSDLLELLDLPMPSVIADVLELVNTILQNKELPEQWTQSLFERVVLNLFTKYPPECYILAIAVIRTVMLVHSSAEAVCSYLLSWVGAQSPEFGRFAKLIASESPSECELEIATEKLVSVCKH